MNIDERIKHQTFWDAFITSCVIPYGIWLLYLYFKSKFSKEH